MLEVLVYRVFLVWLVIWLGYPVTLVTDTQASNDSCSTEALLWRWIRRCSERNNILPVASINSGYGSRNHISSFFYSDSVKWNSWLFCNSFSSSSRICILQWYCNWNIQICLYVKFTDDVLATLLPVPCTVKLQNKCIVVSMMKKE